MRSLGRVDPPLEATFVHQGAHARGAHAEGVKVGVGSIQHIRKRAGVHAEPRQYETEIPLASQVESLAEAAGHPRHDSMNAAQLRGIAESARCSTTDAAASSAMGPRSAVQAPPSRPTPRMALITTGRNPTMRTRDAHAGSRAVCSLTARPCSVASNSAAAITWSGAQHRFRRTVRRTRSTRQRHAPGRLGVRTLGSDPPHRRRGAATRRCRTPTTSSYRALAAAGWGEKGHFRQARGTSRVRFPKQ